MYLIKCAESNLKSCVQNRENIIEVKIAEQKLAQLFDERTLCSFVVLVQPILASENGEIETELFIKLATNDHKFHAFHHRHPCLLADSKRANVEYNSAILITNLRLG